MDPNTDSTILDQIQPISKYFKDPSRYLSFEDSYYGRYTKNTPHLYLCTLLVQKYPELLSYISDFVKSNPESVNERNHNSWTPIHYCSLFSNVHPIYSNTLAILLQGSPNLFSQDKEGFTPLHLLMFAFKDENSIKSLNLLLDSGANINMQTHQGSTPLHILINTMTPYCTSAFYETKCEAIRLLINETNLYLKCGNGNNVLHLLAMRHAIPSIKQVLIELINNNTAFNGKNKQGQTPNYYFDEELNNLMDRKMYKDAFDETNTNTLPPEVTVFATYLFSKL